MILPPLEALLVRGFFEPDDYKTAGGFTRCLSTGTSVPMAAALSGMGHVALRLGRQHGSEMRQEPGDDFVEVLNRGDDYAFPYTDTTAPRVTRLSGDARNMIVAATSSTFAQPA